MSAPFNIPVEGEPDLPWDYFVLQAARGGVRVPLWVGLAVTRAIGDRLGKSADEVTGEEVEAVLGGLPEDPSPKLLWLFRRFEQPIPSSADAFRLSEDQVRGSFRGVVPQLDLVHDAALMLLREYSSEHFFACMEAIEDPEQWDARAAIAAMLYVCLVRGESGGFEVTA